jgi:polyisoprenyl-phosphate glycosyltransferase
LQDVPGWASLMVAVLFLGGVQLISIGILGQYIARIYDEVKQRPQFVIKRQLGFGNAGAKEDDESIYASRTRISV